MLVEVVNNDIGRAVRALKSKLGKDGLLSELRRREYYLSPSEWRKKKDTIALARKQKHRKVKVWKFKTKKRGGH